MADATPLVSDELRPFMLRLGAAVSGAIVSVMLMPGLTRRQALVTFCVGSLASMWATPAVATYFSITTPDYIGFIGFVVGLFGMIVLAAALQYAQERKFTELVGIFRTRQLPGGEK